MYKNECSWCKHGNVVSITKVRQWFVQTSFCQSEQAARVFLHPNSCTIMSSAVGDRVIKEGWLKKKNRKGACPRLYTFVRCPFASKAVLSYCLAVVDCIHFTSGFFCGQFRLRVWRILVFAPMVFILRQFTMRSINGSQVTSQRLKSSDGLC
jgi:hypothetical protein